MSKSIQASFDQISNLPKGQNPERKHANLSYVVNNVMLWRQKIAGNGKQRRREAQWFNTQGGGRYSTVKL